MLHFPDKTVTPLYIASCTFATKCAAPLYIARFTSIKLSLIGLARRAVWSKLAQAGLDNLTRYSRRNRLLRTYAYRHVDMTRHAACCLDARPGGHNRQRGYVRLSR